MVQAKEAKFLLPDRTINVESWLQHIADSYSSTELNLIRNACMLSQLMGEQKPTLNGVSCLQEGLAMAEILESLQAGAVAIAAAIVYSSIQYAGLDLEDIKEQLGEEVAYLVHGVEQMSVLHSLQHIMQEHEQNHRHMDNLRKMLLAMVEDVRVVLIKLAERTCLLRAVQIWPDSERKKIAQETFDIYAPLANRLGVYSIKWELEDLSFRYHNPAEYKEIAQLLNGRRIEREHYVQNMIEKLKSVLKESGINKADINGRAKHIYSIYRKMVRKRVTFNRIYDALAIRILVPTIEDCYAALGVVHATWPQIPGEFDDYIATPKANGYQSIHTAIIGPDEKNVEIQIRTYEMHHISELGVAAHWHYKEGGKKPTHEGKIAWLRQVLEWQKELTASDEKEGPAIGEAINDDRIYVFTPTGEIKDLPVNSTPLDFAYHIHSEVGHRCRGAKVNGVIVPLNYQLKTAEQVEVLTGREPHPSRDWMNPHLGYLTSSRARARVHHWFKQQDYQKNLEDGQSLLKSELQRLGLDKIDYDYIVNKFVLKSLDDLFAAIGCGDIRVNQVVGVIQSRIAHEQPPQPVPLKPPRSLSEQTPKDIYIEGVGSLLTHMARCCQPIPGEQIVGYITRGRGVSVHRQDCQNILHAGSNTKERLIEVQWGIKPQQMYPVTLVIDAYDRRDLVRDITTVVSSENINVIALNTLTDTTNHLAHTLLTIEIDDLTRLNKIIDRVQKLPNMIQVRRASRES